MYFLLVILISTSLPLLNLSDFVNQHQEITKSEIVKQLPDLSLLSQNQEITVYSVQSSIPVNPIIPINFQDIFEAILFSGMLILLCKLIVQIISIFKILKRSKPTSINGIEIQNLEENISPFSFFNLIFINTNQHSKSDLSEIIIHEYTHAKQGHSYDVLLAELFCAVFWINPFAWLLRKFLKQNLEFLTDNTVLQSGFEVKNYQYNLLKISGLNISNITNSFNLSDLKMRILMMNRKRTSNLHLLKYFLMIPIGAVIILAFNISKARSFDAQKSVFQNLKETVSSVKLVKSSPKKIIEILEEENEGKTIALLLENESLEDTIKVKKQNSSISKGLSTFFKLIDSKTEKPLERVQILDRKKNILGETNFQGIAIIDLPFSNVEVEQYFNGATGSRSVLFKHKDYPISESNLLQNTNSYTFYFEDGKFIDKETPKPESFTFEITDDMRKSKNWTKIFNDKIKEHSVTTLRSDGSVWIEPKTKWFYCKEDIIKELKQTQEYSIEKRPVYMVNGKVVVHDFKWDELSIHSLVSLNYWKPEDGELMQGKYGEQAKNGMYDLMVLEKSKIAVNSKNYNSEPSLNNLPKFERCTPSVDFPVNALYVIDGKEVDSGFLHKNIKPENIESLEVMNPEIAQKKYGEKGKKGVILISTKKINKLH